MEVPQRGPGADSEECHVMRLKKTLTDSLKNMCIQTDIVLSSLHPLIVLFPAIFVLKYKTDSRASELVHNGSRA